MSVLVTGGAGFIGSHVVKQLQEAGEDVVVLDDLSSGVAGRIPGTSLVEASVLDYPTLQDTVRRYGVDSVVHMAGLILVGESESKASAYWATNVGGSLNLLRAMKEEEVRHVVFSSSAAVYGGGLKSAPSPEGSPLVPLNPYGWSKLTAEYLFASSATAGMISHVSLRYFNVAGSGYLRRPAPHLIPRVAHAALGLEESFTINGSNYQTPDGTCIRDYVHVLDLASAHVAALRYLRQGGKSLALNCGYGQGYSVREVVEAVKKVSGKDFKVLVGDKRPGDPAVLIAEASLIQRVLDWKPRLNSLEAIIRDDLEFAQRTFVR